MLVPLSWLIETVPDLAGRPVAELSRRLTDAGLAVEHVHVTGGLTGVVAGRVTQIEELTGFKKPIRHCQVDVGSAVQSIVCGARNFAVGDLVAVAMPGTVLAGGFQIASRTTYGRLSDGMICSVRELGLGEDQEGIWVLDPSTEPGSDPLEGMRETVLDINVTPDRGYCLSLRGIGREAATAFGLPFRDPAVAVERDPDVPAGHPVRVEDGHACRRYVARVLGEVSATAEVPEHLRRRLSAAGMRSISAPVDITNLVMLGLGQPLHAFDADSVQGSIVVRRALPGEALTTLDKVERVLHPEDLVIADDSGPIALAGVMGGLSTEITASTTRVIVESAHFDPTCVTRTVRRHRLASEASRRFERGVDPALAPAALAAAASLFTQLCGAVAQAGLTDIDLRIADPQLQLRARAATQKAGRDYSVEVVRARLTEVGCRVTGEELLQVTPPSWRPDLVGEAELVEEVLRLEGYASIPSVLPRVAPGAGLTLNQLARRSVGRALAHAGWVEAVVPPFLAASAIEDLQLEPDDDRRNATVIANPLAEDAALLRTTLLPGLLQSLARNEGRGLRDMGLYEVGLVFRPGAGPLPPAPRLGTAGAPSRQELAELEASLPHQPRHVALVAGGDRTSAGWHGGATEVTWADAVEAAHTVAAAVGVHLDVTADRHAPWHPGRCAALRIGGVLVGHAGQLHPRVAAAFGVPAATVVAELDLDLLLAGRGAENVRVPVISTFPPVTRDVALVVEDTVGAAAVEQALRVGAGELVESLRLFDRYTGGQVGAGKVSLAYRLVLRAPDRTLTDEEANAVRDAAVTAARGLGAVLR
jgi:phenylalanyl-tRNA synthetase beta chain